MPKVGNNNCLALCHPCHSVQGYCKFFSARCWCSSMSLFVLHAVIQSVSQYVVFGTSVTPTAYIVLILANCCYHHFPPVFLYAYFFLFIFFIFALLSLPLFVNYFVPMDSLSLLFLNRANTNLT